MEKFDVTVIGGGLAGMAASIHLVRAGLRVICVEAASGDTDAVGESLDWSAPDLLKDLGLPMEELIRRGIATHKRHVIFKLQDGAEQHYVPGAWLGHAPFHAELRTLYVDRTAGGGGGEPGSVLRKPVRTARYTCGRTSLTTI
jgi:menaquinone-9 beta-reductase